MAATLPSLRVEGEKKILILEKNGEKGGMFPRQPENGAG